MKALLQELASTEDRWDAVAWVGAGRGNGLEAVRALGAGRVACIEPHPGLRGRLAKRLEPGDRESLQSRPLWRADETATFHVANDAVSSTLLSPDRAWAGRPNLKVVEEVEVHCQGPGTLRESLALDDDARILLILDIGAAADVVVADSPEASLRGFGTILLPAGCARAATVLRQRGYAPLAGIGDGDWLLLSTGGRDSREAREHALQGELDDARRQLSGAAGEIAGLQAALEDARRELEKQAANAEALRRQLDEQTADAARLHRQLDEQATNAEALRHQLADQATQADATNQALAGERDAQAARATELQQYITNFSNESAQTIAALTAERDTAHAGLAEKTALAERLEAERDAAQGRIGALEPELAEARRSASLAMKLQAQRDADLADLQQRYRESQAVQERQRELLGRLGERLGLASRYFHQLAEERDAADARLQPSVEAEAPVRARRRTVKRAGRKATRPVED